MNELIRNYNLQIEGKEKQLLARVDVFSLDSLQTGSNGHEAHAKAGQTSAPYRPWLIVGGGAAIAGFIGRVGDFEHMRDFEHMSDSMRNLATTVLVVGLCSVCYGILKWYNKSQSRSSTADGTVDYQALKKKIADETKGLADAVKKDWDDFIAPINKDIQKKLKSMDEQPRLNDALAKTYYVESIMVDQQTLLFELEKVEWNANFVSKAKALAEQFIDGLKSAIADTARRQIERYNSILAILNDDVVN